MSSIRSPISKGMLLKMRPGSILWRPSTLISETRKFSAAKIEKLRTTKTKLSIFFIGNYVGYKMPLYTANSIRREKIFMQVTGRKAYFLSVFF
jgi:hypothetical protein